jgi:hypothetical protein
MIALSILWLGFGYFPRYRYFEWRLPSVFCFYKVTIFLEYLTELYFSFDSGLLLAWFLSARGVAL